MLALILSFLKSHWQTTLIASAVAGIAATIALQRAEIHHLENKLTECHAESASLESSNKALVAAIQDQNTAIASLQVLGRRKQSAAARNLTRARGQADLYSRKASQIEAYAAGADDCASLRRLVNEFIP